jgi:hypothetical protein
VSEFAKAQAWLRNAVKQGYVDESGMHDTDKHPDEAWRHLKVLANATCATCKWAEGGTFMLVCVRHLAPSPTMHPKDPSYDTLPVSPDHGCVQWEAK